jgi:malonyl-CoA O-methyltransferase
MTLSAATASDAQAARRPVDSRALALQQRRLQRQPQPPWLHAEAARRMADKLPAIRLQPASVLDWGAFLGASGPLLAQAYPQARLLSVEPDAARRQQAAASAPARPWWQPTRWRPPLPVVLAPEDLAPGAAQLLWSNMHLHAVADPMALLAAWHRATGVGGFLMFSTLGPGTLQGLRSLYAQLGWPPPMAPLVDMHDLGDMLVQTGFADPVMDQETLTLSWATPEALLAELRSLGGNAAPGRHAGLRTPRWRRRCAKPWQALAGADGRLRWPSSSSTATPSASLRARASARRRRCPWRTCAPWPGPVGTRT